MNVDAINSLPDGVATDRTPRSRPAGFVASGSAGPFRIEATLPSGERIEGARTHRSMESVRQQLIRTAPQWRAVMPGTKFRITEAREPKP